MKNDIRTRADIELLVNTFYSEATTDPLIGFFFTEVAKLDLSTHLPVMHDFWETLLLGNIAYKGNPMLRHIAMDKIAPMEPAHFERWLQLWKATVDTLFEGPVATQARDKATSIAFLMQSKISISRSNISKSSGQ